MYASGMRNPYRWSFDRQTGDMYVGDVGGTREEITFIPAAQTRGANLGWNCWSGADHIDMGCNPANYFPPTYDYPSGPDVVIGGYLVRDTDLPSFAGQYLFGRFDTGIIMKLGPRPRCRRPTPGSTWRTSRASARTASGTCTPPRSRARSTGSARAAGCSRRPPSAASTRRLPWPRPPATRTSCSSSRRPVACSCALRQGPPSSSTSPHRSRTAASRDSWRSRWHPTTPRATGCSCSTTTTAVTSRSTSTATACARR